MSADYAWLVICTMSVCRRVLIRLGCLMLTTRLMLGRTINLVFGMRWMTLTSRLGGASRLELFITINILALLSVRSVSIPLRLLTVGSRLVNMLTGALVSRLDIRWGLLGGMAALKVQVWASTSLRLADARWVWLRAGVSVVPLVESMTGVRPRVIWVIGAGSLRPILWTFLVEAVRNVILCIWLLNLRGCRLVSVTTATLFTERLIRTIGLSGVAVLRI